MENAIPAKFNLKQTVDEVSPDIERIESEDEKIAKLSKDERWDALKDRIKRKIQSAKDSATVTQNTVGLIEDMEQFGFKCALKDLLVEFGESIISDVEETAKILNKKKQDETE